MHPSVRCYSFYAPPLPGEMSDKVIKQLQDRQAGGGMPHAFTRSVYAASLPSMRLQSVLDLHTGCVNHVAFNDAGMPSY